MDQQRSEARSMKQLDKQQPSKIYRGMWDAAAIARRTADADLARGIVD